MAKHEIQSKQEQKSVSGGWALFIFGALFLIVILLGLLL